MTVPVANSPDDGEVGPAPPPKFEILRGIDLITQYPELDPPVIEGVLRKGETCNLIASPKIGKSWFCLGLGICLTLGREWLGYAVTPSPVLYIDNELKKETLSHRFAKVCYGYGIEPQSCACDFLALRGKLTDVNGLFPLFEQIGEKYDVIIMDAKYRFQLSGTSENSNTDEARFYNTIDRYAARAEAAVVLVHHSTKGNQSSKEITDVGAGAGSQSRAADAHLVIRPHQEPELFVLDGVVRSFAPPESKTIQFDWPIWRAVEEVAPVLKPELSRADYKQKSRDEAALNQAMEVFHANHEVTTKLLRKRTGWGPDRANRIIGLLISAHRIRLLREDLHPNQSTYEVYTLNQDQTEADLEFPF